MNRTLSKEIMHRSMLKINSTKILLKKTKYCTKSKAIIASIYLKDRKKATIIIWT